MVVILTLSATRGADNIRMWCSSLSYHPPGIIRFHRSGLHFRIIRIGGKSVNSVTPITIFLLS